MKKSELKNGAVLEDREGNRYIKIDGMFLNTEIGCGFFSAEDYNEDLIVGNGYGVMYDIVKVNNNTEKKYREGYNAIYETIIKGEWAWERNDELDKNEIAYLKPILSEYEEQYHTIKKLSSKNGVYIHLIINNINIDMPVIPNPDMFKIMEFNKEYKVKYYKIYE